MKRLKAKLTAIWMILTAKSVTLVAQRHLGEAPQVTNFGQGTIQDMVIIATCIRRLCTGFAEEINELATQSGELHTLQEFRSAITELEKA